MANFIDRLSDQVAQKREELRQTLRQDARPQEQALQRLVKDHWRGLPKTKVGERHPAFAVDGSRAVRHLANGAYLFVAQALIVGERDDDRQEDADVRILPGTTPSKSIERFAELMMHQLESGLARKCTDKMRSGSVLFFDGALYGELPQLYPLEIEGTPYKIPEAILDDYMYLFGLCKKRNLILVSIAKTSREAAHSKVWWKDALKKKQVKDEKIPPEISDSEIIFRWTDQRAGFSTPVLFGKRSFSKGGEAVLLEKVKDAPAIVSFFVRLADFDDALRIDVPASCLGRNESIADIETDEEILLGQPEELQRVAPILELLAADYGGPDVYNALLYSVDREVRLRQEMMDQVYLSLIQNTLGPDVELRLDRSERRYHSR